MRFAVLAIGLLGVASAALFARYGLDRGASAEALSAWRLTVASLGLVLWRLAVPAKRRLPSGDRWRAVVAGVFLALHFATWIASLRYVSVARSTLLVCTAPVWAGIAGVFVPSLRPRPIFWLGLGIAAVGTWLVTATAKPVASLIEPAWLGDLLAVLGAICIVPYLMISQRLQKGVDTLTTVSWIYASAGAGLLGVLVLEGAAAPPTSSEVWIAILGMAVFAQLVGHSSLNWCLRHFSPTEVAASTLLEPVFAGALAWAILGESVGWLQGLGAAVLLVGVGISLSAPRAAPPLVTID